MRCPVPSILGMVISAANANGTSDIATYIQWCRRHYARGWQHGPRAYINLPSSSSKPSSIGLLSSIWSPHHRRRAPESRPIPVLDGIPHQIAPCVWAETESNSINGPDWCASYVSQYFYAHCRDEGLPDSVSSPSYICLCCLQSSGTVPTMSNALSTRSMTFH